MSKVKIYTTPTCGWCMRTKDYLTDKGIKYKEVDVSRSRDEAIAMVEKSGQMGVPVLDIDGTVIIGFDKFAIDAALFGN
jgi:glutaredoxin 3